MRTLLPLTGLLMLALAACSPSAPDAATQFITSAAPPPASAKIDDNGLARDDYGRPFSYALLGKPLPRLTGTTVSGEDVDTSRFDKWTVIDVWGLWCGDCMADSKYVAELASRAADHDINFLSVHVPASATRATPAEMFGKYGSVEAYFDTAGFSYPTLVDTDASLRDRLQIAWTPTYLLVSPDGIVRGFRTELSAAGKTPVEDFLEAIKKTRENQIAKADTLRRNAAIGPDGAVSLSGTTLFTSGAIRAAFPDYLVVADSEDTVDGSIPVFRILPPLSATGSTPLYTIWPDWTRGSVLAVATQNPDVKGPDGLVIGQTRLADISNSFPEDACKPSTISGRAMLTCSEAETDGNFAISFAANTESPGESLLSEMTYLPPEPAR